MLVTMKEILDKAKEGNYAVPAPNVFYELETRAVLELAEELNSPLILDVNPTFGPAIRELAKEAKVPVAINLDHGGAYEKCIEAILNGVSSIMVDRSSLPYEENVAQVKELVKVAHAGGLSVEAELGHVGQGEQYDVDGKRAFTVPEEAANYVKETGVDALAVAIGTAHGQYHGEPKLHFDILEEITKVVDSPLVLHGGSGTGFENIGKACKMGINKVNVNTDLIMGAWAELKKDIDAKSPYMLYRNICDGYKNVLRQYMEVCGCIGKAWMPEVVGVLNSPMGRYDNRKIEG